MIFFRCPRCNHEASAPEESIGKKAYCSTCYYSLIVPAQSTVTSDGTTELYGVDDRPLDVRDLQDRVFASFPCPLCGTLLSVKPEQIGTTIECPDCGTFSEVPESIRDRLATRKWRKPPPLPADPDHDLPGSGETDGGTPPGNEEDALDIYAVSAGNGKTNPFLALRSFPVRCHLCDTLMYATDAEVGTMKRCPDCQSETEVRQPVETRENQTHITRGFEGGNAYDLSGSDAPHGTRLVPVVCSLCETRMYAAESSIGGVKICPDCGTSNPILDVPEKERIVYELTGTDYAVSEISIPDRPKIRVGIDYRRVEGSLDREHWKKRSNDKRDSGGNATEYEEEEDDREVFVQEKKPGRFAPRHWDVSIMPGLFQPFSRHRFLADAMGGIIFLFITGLILGALYDFTLAVGWGWPENAFPAMLGVVILIFSMQRVVTHGMSLFVESASGNDDCDEGIDFQAVVGLGLVLWLLALSLIACAPGGAVYRFFFHSPPLEGEERGIASLIGIYLSCRISFTIFFPYFFLSAMETGSMIAPISIPTLFSIYRFPGCWIRLFLISFPILALPDLVVIGIALLPNSLLLCSAYFGIGAAIAGLIMLLYFRLLGRFAWMLARRINTAGDQIENDA